MCRINGGQKASLHGPDCGVLFVPLSDWGWRGPDLTGLRGGGRKERGSGWGREAITHIQ